MKIINAVSGIFLATAVMAFRPMSHQNFSSTENGPLEYHGHRRLLHQDMDGVVTDGVLTQVTSNWAGPIVGPPATDQIYYAIIGSFVLPDPKPDPSAGKTPGSWAGAAWVGIDGQNSNESLFQAGMLWAVTVFANGTTSTEYVGITEWYPAPAILLDNFSASAGNVITVLCEAATSSTGQCTLENENTHQKVVTQMKVPDGAPNLVGQHAEWIVEDFEQGNNQVAFANFSKVEWFNCQAATASKGPNGSVSGATTFFNPDSAGEMDILNPMLGGPNLTSTTATGQNITFLYVDALHDGPLESHGRIRPLDQDTNEVVIDGVVAFPSGNWAGMVSGPPAQDEIYYAVIGSFVVPDPKPPAGENSPTTWSGSAWVGLDGFDQGDTLFQAGMDWNVEVFANGSTSTSYRPWHEWIPDPSVAFTEDFPISAGDIMTVLCESSTSTTGQCTLKNENTKKTIRSEMTAPVGQALTGQHAEWIVEDFEGEIGLVPFANFTKVKWFNCQAATATKGSNGTVSGATTFYDPGNAQTVSIIQTTGNINVTLTTTSGQNMTVLYVL